jgi:DNA polymerase
MAGEETLKAAALSAKACRNCELWRNATQTVFGEGPEGAALMLVGEQPGDHEDLQGRPFIGPAGRLLDRALAEAGIERRSVYVTNAVKHFKFAPRGKRRIHQKPGAVEIVACRTWLETELKLVRPRVVVAMGSTAARAVLGRTVTIARLRGEIMPLEEGRSVLVTIHPSALLRLVDVRDRAGAYTAFVADLKAAKEAL